MDNRIKTYHQSTAILLFIGLPLLFYVIGDFPRRSLLKESISILTILAFFIMLLQFYLSRINDKFISGHKMSRVINWHKTLGYIFVGILLFHPFLIVLPRYFEAGVGVKDAFTELLSNFNKQDIFLGLTAWTLMITIGITSLFRDKLPMSYKTWRATHGILSAIFIASASTHVIGIGRHINTTFTWLILFLSLFGIVLLLRTYLFKSSHSKNIEAHVKK